MKRIISIVALAFALVAVPRFVAYSDASQQGRESSRTSALLALGLAALGGLRIVSRNNLWPRN
jgi:hypothetical protein